METSTTLRFTLQHRVLNTPEILTTIFRHIQNATILNPFDNSLVTQVTQLKNYFFNQASYEAVYSIISRMPVFQGLPKLNIAIDANNKKIVKTNNDLVDRLYCLIREFPIYDNFHNPNYWKSGWLNLVHLQNFSALAKL